MVSKILILPVGIKCNLGCKYCVNNSQRDCEDSKTGVMEISTLRRIFEDVKSLLDPEKKLTIIWNGGEATLAGIEFYRIAVQLEREIFGEKEIENGIQTNATFIDEDWCRFFKENNFMPSISLDGPDWLHNQVRRYKSGKGTYERVFNAYQLMRSFELPVGVLSVITPINVEYPEEMMNWLEESKIYRWDFLLCFEPPESDIGLTVSNSQSTDFLIKLFDEWFVKDDPRIRIRTFRDIIQSQLGNKPALCSWQRGCLKFASFDRNGDVFLCGKFHIYPETCYGNILKQSLAEIFNNPRTVEINQEIYDCQKGCRDCEWLNSCGGGCSFTRYSLSKKFDAPFVHCEVRKALFEHIYNRIKCFI